MNQEHIDKITALYEKGKGDEGNQLFIDFINDGGSITNEEYLKLLKQTEKWTEGDQSHNTYNLRGLIYSSTKNEVNAIDEFKTSISIKPLYSKSYYYRGISFNKTKQFSEAIADFTKSIELSPRNAKAYLHRGNAYRSTKDFEKSIFDFDRAININPNNHLAYYFRGISYSELNNYEQAIENFTLALNLDPNSINTYFYRATCYYQLKDSKNAIIDYNKVIELDPKNQNAYYNLGLSYSQANNNNKAILNFSKAIEINPNHAHAIYARGRQYKLKGRYENALKDFQLHQNLDDTDYWHEQSQKHIKELQELIKYDSLKVLDSDIEKVKSLLLFKEEKITHFTGLSVSNILITNKDSLFRLSESNFLNDTSEGQRLNDYLSPENGNYSNGNSIPFVGKPFIGSFVPVTKHNDLTLWRMYAKEDQQEAKGCSLTFSREDFIESIKETVIPKPEVSEETNAAELSKNDKTSSNSIIDDDFKFYRVAYLTDKDKCLIPGAEEMQDNLCSTLESLKKSVNSILKKKDPELNLLLRSRLSDIQFLFKGDEYIYESEIRLVMQGIGITKVCENLNGQPKVYISIAPIKPSLKNITIGPKVEKAEEWAAFFNYNLNGDTEKKVDIQISQLPFK